MFGIILNRIKKSKIFSVSLDGTSDAGQLTLIFRYLERDLPVERFLIFLPNQGLKAQNMFDDLKISWKKISWT